MEKNKEVQRQMCTEKIMNDYPDRHTIITLLKKRFPSNNPSSWTKHSDNVLRKWYDEYIR